MLKFKNVGTLDLKLTEIEIANGLYNIPRLSVGDKILVTLPSPKLQNITTISRHYRWYLQNNFANDHETLCRLHQQLVCETYFIVGIHTCDMELIEGKTKKLKFRESKNIYDCYYLVKKRNYNKYMMQLLSDNKKIDYIIMKPCSEIDKAINFGFIEIV